MTTTCPVCGSECRIQGDPASVTRWYEPAGQGQLDVANQRITELEAKLRGMTTTMQHWRGLAGQMTEARDALLGEEGVLREALEAEMSHTRERIESVTAGLVNIQRHRDAWRRYATQGGPKPGDYVEDAPALASGAGAKEAAVIEAVVPDQTAAIVQQVTAAMHQPAITTDSMMEVVRAAVEWASGDHVTATKERRLMAAVAIYQEGC